MGSSFSVLCFVSLFLFFVCGCWNSQCSNPSSANCKRGSQKSLEGDRWDHPSTVILSAHSLCLSLISVAFCFLVHILKRMITLPNPNMFPQPVRRKYECDIKHNDLDTRPLWCRRGDWFAYASVTTSGSVADLVTRHVVLKWSNLMSSNLSNFKSWLHKNWGLLYFSMCVLMLY